MLSFCPKLFFSSEKSHAHVQYAYNICATFQTDCLKTLRGVDYTNLLPNIELNLKIVHYKAPKAVIFSKIIFLPAKSHMHMFDMLVTYV